MSQAKFTLIGFYNHMKAIESDLFMNLDLPTGIDKEIIINNILMRGGEFEVLYSNPFFLRDSITTWSKKWYWTFDKWIKAINIKYEPLNNYDRHEEWTDEGQDTRSTTNNETVNTENHITDSTTGTNADTAEHQISAFDTSDYSNKDKAITNGNTSSNGQNDSTGTVSGETIGSDMLDTNKKHIGRMWGNIGVTTSQQMLQSEIDIAMFNLYDKIADIFLQEYVLPIY